MSTSPPTKPDLDSVEAVGELVRRFYEQVAQDDLLGPMFADVAGVAWPEHIDKLTNFWTRTLFGIGQYQANPLAKHERIHGQRSFTAAHFRHWLDLFGETVDDRWEGAMATKTKRVAHKVARLHSTKLLGEPFDGVEAEAPRASASLLQLDKKRPN